MISPIEYRSVIKFFVLQGKSCKDIFDQLETTYQNDAPSLTTVKYWVREFKGGRTSVFDDPREGRPQEISDSTDEKLMDIVREHRRISVKLLANCLKISVGSVHAKLKDLGIRKLCSRFVPRFLTGEMMQNRLESCQKNLKIWEEHGDKFLHNIITEDETPLSMYLPESKRESAEWKLPGEKPSLKMRSGTSHGRTWMLSIFWDANGVLSMDFADKHTTINAKYYSDLIVAARRERRKSKGLPLWFLHDNAPVHTAAISRAAIDNSGFTPLYHAPYSPDLAPSDFWLFQSLKKHLRGQRFSDSNELRDTVEKFLADCPKKFFQDAFLELVTRWKRCVERNGSYVEK